LFLFKEDILNFWFLFISTAHTEMEKEKQEEIEKLHKEIDKRGTWVLL
jgi:hypothetical protein